MYFYELMSAFLLKIFAIFLYRPNIFQPLHSLTFSSIIDILISLGRYILSPFIRQIMCKSKKEHVEKKVNDVHTYIY